MIKIGITGQAGFLGTHLYNTLGLDPDSFQRIPFRDAYFEDDSRLREFVANCDVIIHLAALNRHDDQKVIYETNLKLVDQVIAACEYSGSKPHIIFSSSIQEEQDNLYGQSKKEGRKRFEQWAEKNNARFTGIVIPNIFGPFSLPYYNSVVATFCHQLTHNENPRIIQDSSVKLIYVADVIKLMLECISDEMSVGGKIMTLSSESIKNVTEIKVSELLEILNSYKEKYFLRGEIPDLGTAFKRNLFNTFQGYIDHKRFFPFKLKMHQDDRGHFVETMKLESGGQVSFSTTRPGITRGNHYHTRKAERFAVIKGKAKIELRKTGTEEVLSFELDGKEPSFVDMPVWYTHNITNTGSDELYTLFWISELYDPEDPDTYFEKV